VLTLDSGDPTKCRDARIVLGGVAPIPWRLPEVEALLKEQRLTRELAAKAGTLAVKDARPLSKNAYKVAMVEAMVRRAIEGLAAPRA
jgi:xanthine dehydrogenase YagS FAD-binding subunit